MALCAAMQVASDTLAALASVICFAREPYAALFASSLTAGQIARCDATCTCLASLFKWGHRWGGRQPTDRRREMVLEHLRDADIGLTLLFEGTHDQERRQILARLLIDLSILKRCGRTVVLEGIGTCEWSINVRAFPTGRQFRIVRRSDW